MNEKDIKTRSESWTFAYLQHRNLVGYDNLVDIMRRGTNKGQAAARFTLPLHKNPRTNLIFLWEHWEGAGVEQIVIMLENKHNGESTYYGAIDIEGVLRPSSALRQSDNEHKRAVWYLIQKLRDNPEKVFTVLGKQTGICCLCGRELTNPKSIAIGIGPKCAAKYELDYKMKYDIDQFIH